MVNGQNFIITKNIAGTFQREKCLPNLLVNIIQLIINLPINFKKSKYIYFKIEGLLTSMIGIKSYKRSKFD